MSKQVTSTGCPTRWNSILTPYIFFPKDVRWIECSLSHMEAMEVSGSECHSQRGPSHSKTTLPWLHDLYLPNFFKDPFPLGNILLLLSIRFQPIHGDTLSSSQKPQLREQLVFSSHSLSHVPLCHLGKARSNVLIWLSSQKIACLCSLSTPSLTLLSYLLLLLLMLSLLLSLLLLLSLFLLLQVQDGVVFDSVRIKNFVSIAVNVIVLR